MKRMLKCQSLVYKYCPSCFTKEIWPFDNNIKKHFLCLHIQNKQTLSRTQAEMALKGKDIIYPQQSTW